ncbi:ttr-31 [Pristionchus pacificus]|uniref:Ttr-31 n=1 Tax=Pristionchus pacificus TaxID=54126 RepID=A0A2A6CTJ7_PRIPA|nr:ttr-31 [Pristionchus pacificus]|eukprot:PDM81438.1 ttr-31 [Pristionchus pacificus]
MQLLSILLIVPLAAALPTLFEKKLQVVSVTGKLICNGKPYEHAKVKLYDENLALPDRFLAEGVSKADGSYTLTGNTTRYFTIDPKVNLYHNCNDEKVEGWRKVQIRIPKEYITDGKEEKTFDAGVLNISGTLPGEERDYIN